MFRNTSTVLALLVVAGLSSSAADAATYRVNSVEMTDDGYCDALTADRDCTLIEAIRAANANPHALSVVSLPEGVVYTLLEPYEKGTGLPTIEGKVVIRSAGGGARIERETGMWAPQFRLLRVADGARLRLERVTLANGHTANASSSGGAILNEGHLVLSRSRIVNSRSEAHGGAIANYGSMRVIKSELRENHAMYGGGAVYSVSDDGRTRVRFAGSVIADNEVGEAVCCEAATAMARYEEPRFQQMARAVGGTSVVERSQAAASPARDVEAGVEAALAASHEDLDDATRILRVIRRYLPRVRTCYQQSLNANPDLAGRVEAAWLIDDGRVTDVQIEATPDLALGECIAETIARWEFGSVDAAEVAYPFVLARGS